MTRSSLSVLKPYLPPDGAAFHTKSTFPLADVANDLCRIASFLQHHAPSSKLELFHDWWEHDALHFPRGETSYHNLFQMIGTPRGLIESMTGDHRVFITVSPDERDWYLRFLADWDDNDTNLIGEYSITLGRTLTSEFATDLVPQLKCPTTTKEAVSYFRRIEP